jgi:hypothetical protein
MNPADNVIPLLARGRKRKYVYWEMLLSRADGQSSEFLSMCSWYSFNLYSPYAIALCDWRMKEMFSSVGYGFVWSVQVRRSFEVSRRLHLQG